MQEKAVAMELPTSPNPLENGDIGQAKATKDYKCTICNINYIHKYTYVAHMKQMHFGIENGFECDVCHKSYTKFCNLYRHMRTAHNQSLRQYKCEYPNCSRSFRQLTTRRKHYEEFHSHEPLPSHLTRVTKKCRNLDEPNTFQHPTAQPSSSYCNTNTLLVGPSSLLFNKRNNICTICGKTFETSYDLKVHTNNDHKKDMKFRCNICGAQKISKIKLDQHMFTVHNSQHVICDFCQKSLKSKSHLRQHILSVHSGIKPFSCAFCPAKFAAKNTLKVHTRIHTGEKPFKCNVCERRFSQLTPMKKHLITHEKGHRNAVE